MTPIPNDITSKTSQDFQDEEREIVFLIFHFMCRNRSEYNVQAFRSILFLSNGDFKKLIRLYLMYQIDPRDVIGEAEEKAGNPGHWFGIPFEDMPNFKKTILPPPLPPQVVNDLPF